MKFLDWAIVVAYLAYVIWDGIRMTKHSGDVEGYFLANRSLPWWAVGLSVMATQLSAITLVGTTGQAYSDGMRFIQFYYGLPLAMVILCITAVPFFYRAKVYTAYEYLEKRFDAKTRSLTSFFFLDFARFGRRRDYRRAVGNSFNRSRLERNCDDFRYRFDNDRLHDDWRCASRDVDGR
ncbi:MAG: hypothetical protein WKF71_15535 [Pyrinomonadaceae bacterium]